MATSAALDAFAPTLPSKSSLPLWKKLAFYPVGLVALGGYAVFVYTMAVVDTIEREVTALRVSSR